MDPRAAAHLLVSEAVCAPVQLADVHGARLRRTDRTAANVDTVALFEGLFGHSDVDQLVAVIHLQLPGFDVIALLHIDDQVGVRIDEMKLAHDAFKADRTASVIDACDRVMKKYQRQDPHAGILQPTVFPCDGPCDIFSEPFASPPSEEA